MKNQRLLLSFAVLLAAAPVLLSLSGCSDKVGTPTGPGTTGTAGYMGRLVYNDVDHAQQSASPIIAYSDSNGSNLGSLGAGFVWSSGSGWFAWMGTHEKDTGTFITNNSGTETFQVDTATWYKGYPIMSLDGSHVAVMERTDYYGNARLVVFSLTYLSNPDTVIVHRYIISNSPGHETLPCFSPDGSRIAFYDSVDGGQWLSIANSDGSVANKIATISEWGEDYAGAIDWSPTGDKLAFFDNGKLDVVNADGSGRVTVDSGGMASWSPDGKTLAYLSGEGDIFLTSDLGKTKRNITNTNQLFEGYPRWSPDGKKIACVSWPAGTDPDFTTTSVKLIDVATGASKILATPGYVATWLR